jgi:predicted AlkP superfamily pyrophosphatase or phosphodiesterase
LETSMPRTASIILRFFSSGPYTASAPHRSTLYTGSAPQRVPGYRPD